MKRWLFRIGRLLGTDWELKLGALVVACGVWLNVFRSMSEERIVRDVPIRIDLPASLLDKATILDPSRREIDVILRGPKSALERLEIANLRILHRVPREGIAYGEMRRVLLDRDDLQPRPDQDVQVQVGGLEYRVDHLVTEQVPVHPDMVPGDDRTYDRVVVKPRLVEVRGPASVFERARAVRADPARAAGAGEIRTLPISGETLPLGEDWYDYEVLPRLLDLPVECRERRVRVRVRVSVPRVSTRIEAVPVNLVLPQEFDLVVECPKTLPLVVMRPTAREVRPEEVFLLLDVRELRGRSAGPAEAPLEVRLPPGLDLESPPQGVRIDETGQMRLPVELRQR